MESTDSEWSQSRSEPFNAPKGKRRILVLPAGTEIGLEIFAALGSNQSITLFAAGEDISNHARFLYPEYHVVPNVHVTGWLDILVELCLTLEIDYVFPAHDDVLVALSESSEKIPAVIVTSSRETCQTTRSKSLTYHRFLNIIPVPRVYTNSMDVNDYPVLVKPDRGQGSQGIRIVSNFQELTRAIDNVPDAIICEYLPGDEYTIDCFSSMKHGLQFAGARKRTRMRNGISVNTATENLAEAWDYATAISRTLSLRGAWFFQLKRNTTGTLTLLEIAPRIAGAMAAHRVTGVNFPMLSILEQEDAEIQIVTNPGQVVMDRALGNRYLHKIQFNTLYLDLERTLLARDTVNTSLIKLVFISLNQGKRIVLMTGPTNGSIAKLEKYHLTGIFHEIISTTYEVKRSQYIKDANSIYVDDDFDDRIEVALTRGIPTFDTSMVEILCQEANRPDPAVARNRTINNE